MIVANDDQDKHDSYNGPTIRPPERVARRRRSLSPLPDYDTSEAQYRKSYILNQKVAWHQSRMWRAILFLLLTYTLLTIVAGVPIIVTQLKHHRNAEDDNYPLPDPGLLSNQFASSVPSITYANDMSCNTWNATKFDRAPLSYTATLAMQLPVTGDISIRSNATLDDTPVNKLSGNLFVEYDPNLNSDNAQIFVSLHTSTLALRESTLVCYSDDGSNRGVSIFFPDTMIDEDQIAMDIRLTFPQAITPTITPNFNVFLPMFTQEYQDLTKINFDSVNIDGSFRPISVTNIQAPRVTVKNMIGDIIGAFNASEALVLNTLKGVVSASITLIKPIYRPSPTKFLLDTGDEYINANVSFVSPTSDKPLSSYPYFVGNVNNFNAPINVTFNQHDAPPAMPVSITVQNSLAATDIVMDQKFEGSFMAQTKLGRVSIDRGNENSKNDSSVSNKPRTIVYNQGSASSRTGWIGHGEETPDCQSRVDIYSSLGPINLHFGTT